MGSVWDEADCSGMFFELDGKENRSVWGLVHTGLCSSLKPEGGQPEHTP